MKTVAFVPSRLNSERVPAKNIKELGGIPLVNYTLRTLNKVKVIDETVLFASDRSIERYIEKGLRYAFVERPTSLDTQQTSIQDIIADFLTKTDAEIIVLLHITSPFLKSETIAECVEKVTSGQYECAFTGYEIRKFCWFNGKPLNYSLDKPTPRTQDIDPVIVEQSSLYVFKREIFEKTRQRVSLRPYIKFIDHFEGHDIDTPEDFRIAELMVNTGYFPL